MIVRATRKKRSAAALVEFAFVSVAFFLLLFGIFEYSRYLFLLQVTHNAAREGARFAVVHTGDGTTIQQVKDEVTARLASRGNELQGLTIDVYNVDPATGLQVPSTQWNESAFGYAIAVRITGTYRPMLPGFLGTAASINVKATAIMSSEGN